MIIRIYLHTFCTFENRWYVGGAAGSSYFTRSGFLNTKTFPPGTFSFQYFKMVKIYNNVNTLCYSFLLKILHPAISEQRKLYIDRGCWITVSRMRYLLVKVMRWFALDRSYLRTDCMDRFVYWYRISLQASRSMFKSDAMALFNFGKITCVYHSAFILAK